MVYGISPSNKKSIKWITSTTSKTRPQAQARDVLESIAWIEKRPIMDENYLDPIQGQLAHLMDFMSEGFQVL